MLRTLRNSASIVRIALILARHDAGYTLTARDVMSVPLQADLVTLSACRSAGARAYSGEGLVGLSWAFLRAGAGSVVAGLWDVTDMSTATLMADFYGQLVKNVAPAEALRQSKLHLLHSAGAYRKPFYWGPFQLYAGAIEKNTGRALSASSSKSRNRRRSEFPTRPFSRDSAGRRPTPTNRRYRN